MSNARNDSSPFYDVTVPYQARFIEMFIRPDAPPHQLLAWPAGTGKTHVAVNVISRLAGSGNARRILLLTPAPLANIWLRRLRDWTGQTPVLAVDRRMFRELLAAVPVGQDPWPDGVTVISKDLAKRSDIAAEIANSTWDLLVVDEAHGVTGQLLALLGSLVTRGSARRTLFLAVAPPVDALTRALPGLQTIQLSPPEQSALVATPPKRSLIRYVRHQDEIQFLQELRGVAEDLPHNSHGQFVKRHILRRASSCIFSVEETFIRVLRLLKEKSGPDVGHEDDWRVPESQVPVEKCDSETDTDWSETPEIISPWVEVPSAEEKISKLLALLAEVRTDAKLLTLMKLLDDLAATCPDYRPCVLADFASTINYLGMALWEENRSCFSLIGATSSYDSPKIIQEFTSHGGVLLATTVIMRGFDLGFVDALVHYDLPSTRDGMLMRESPVSRYGRTEPYTEYAMVDDSAVLSFENDLLKVHGWESSPSNT